MKAAFYSGATGLMAFQEALDNIGHNLANVNTDGYKSQRVSFQNLLYNNMYANTTEDPLSGNGVRAISAGIQAGQSALSPSDNPLDFAVAGNGWFGVGKDGQKQYTRNGSFGVSTEGDNAFLITQDGGYVLNWEGQRIALTKAEGTENLDYNVADQIGVFSFNNPDMLRPIANNNYLPTNLSGIARRANTDSYELKQYFVEHSGTSMSDELTDMIAIQRSYQVSARVVQTADQNEQTINDLRR